MARSCDQFYIINNNQCITKIDSDHAVYLLIYPESSPENRPSEEQNNIECKLEQKPGKLDLLKEKKKDADEIRARKMKIPISVHDIINMEIDELNDKLYRFELNDAQRALIKDIRRRGLNKVSAQNVRRRKTEQIDELQFEVNVLHKRETELTKQLAQLEKLREAAREKCDKMHKFLTQNVSPEEKTLDLLYGK